jgi:hypothetical protein
LRSDADFWVISTPAVLLRHDLKLIGTAIHVLQLDSNVLDLGFNVLDLDFHLGNFKTSQHQSRRE